LPTTLFALILFICFVTPGFIFEMCRERRRPPRSYSALRETSIIVVSSLAFSLPAIFVLGVLQMIKFPHFPDLQKLAEHPAEYSADNLMAVTLLIVGTVGFAVLIALGWDAGLQMIRRSPVVTRDSVWFEVLVGRARRKDSEAVAVTIELKNGAAILGAVKAHGLNNDNELEWIVLKTHSQWPLQSRSPSGKSPQPIGAAWSYYVVSAEEIRAATVGYLDTPE
jgi:hypothetical protein